MFQDMFSMPQPHNGTGGSEADPIEIPGIATPEFDIFVSQAYG